MAADRLQMGIRRERLSINRVRIEAESMEGSGSAS
jgi:hypothetical protein